MSESFLANFLRVTKKTRPMSQNVHLFREIKHKLPKQAHLLDLLPFVLDCPDTLANVVLLEDAFCIDVYVFFSVFVLALFLACIV